jgi:hypothetical protein
MKLITAEVKKRLKQYPLYSQDGKGKRAKCVVKLFLCVGAWTWYILEADLEEDMAYGIIINGEGEGEYGYISLQELRDVRTWKGLAVERDISFQPTLLKDIDDCYLQSFLSRMYD